MPDGTYELVVSDGNTPRLPKIRPPESPTPCADVGVSEATIKRRVADLVAAGLVMVQRRRNKSQLYRLTRLAGWEPISLVDKPVDDAADDTRPDIRNGQQADRSRNGQQADRTETLIESTIGETFGSGAGGGFPPSTETDPRPGPAGPETGGW